MFKAGGGAGGRVPFPTPRFTGDQKKSQRDGPAPPGARGAGGDKTKRKRRAERGQARTKRGRGGRLRGPRPARRALLLGGGATPSIPGGRRLQRTPKEGPPPYNRPPPFRGGDGCHPYAPTGTPPPMDLPRTSRSEPPSAGDPRTTHLVSRRGRAARRSRVAGAGRRGSPRPWLDHLLLSPGLVNTSATRPVRRCLHQSRSLKTAKATPATSLSKLPLRASRSSTSRGSGRRTARRGRARSPSAPPASPRPPPSSPTKQRGTPGGKENPPEARGGPPRGAGPSNPPSTNPDRRVRVQEAHPAHRDAAGHHAACGCGELGTSRTGQGEPLQLPRCQRSHDRGRPVHGGMLARPRRLDLRSRSPAGHRRQKPCPRGSSLASS